MLKHGTVIASNNMTHLGKAGSTFTMITPLHKNGGVFVIKA